MMKIFFRDTGGIAAVEFALMAPVLIFMIIGIIDYGMYVNVSMKLEGVALAAAQYIRAGGDEADLVTDVLEESSLEGLTADNLDVAYSFACADPDVAADEDTNCGAGDYLREYVVVTMDMTYEAILPYHLTQNTLTISNSIRLQK